MLLAAYAGAVVLAFQLPGVFNVPVMAGGHAALAVALVVHVRTPPVYSTAGADLFFCNPRRLAWSAPSTRRKRFRASTASSGRCSTANTQCSPSSEAPPAALRRPADCNKKMAVLDR